MRRFVLLLLVVAACSKSSGPAANGSAAGSAACSDSDIAEHVNATFAATRTYFGELEKHVATWSDDCEAIRKDLVTLEPAGSAFFVEVMRSRVWSHDLAPECRARVQQYTLSRTEAGELATRAEPLEAKVKPVLERCKDAPGFRDAAEKALKFMRKKKAP